MSPIQVSALIVLGTLVLLVFAPQVLGRVFTWLGWNSGEAEGFSVAPKHERFYLSVLGSLTFAALVWAATPIQGFPESPFNDPVIRVLNEFSTLGLLAAQSLTLGAVVGGSLLALYLLIYRSGRSTGNRSGSHIPLWAGLVSSACPLFVVFVVAAISILFGSVESVSSVGRLLINSW